MGDNRHPAGYIPLTYHELSGSVRFQQPNARDRVPRDDFGRDDNDSQPIGQRGSRSGGFRRNKKRVDARTHTSSNRGGERSNARGPRRQRSIKADGE